MLLNGLNLFLRTRIILRVICETLVGADSVSVSAFEVRRHDLHAAVFRQLMLTIVTERFVRTEAGNDHLFVFDTQFAQYLCYGFRTSHSKAFVVCRFTDRTSVSVDSNLLIRMRLKHIRYAHKNICRLDDRRCVIQVEVDDRLLQLFIECIRRIVRTEINRIMQEDRNRYADVLAEVDAG